MLRETPRFLAAFILWLAVVGYVVAPPVAGAVSGISIDSPEPLEETEYMAVECDMGCRYAEVNITEEKQKIREYLCTDNGWHTQAEIATGSNIISEDAGRIMLDMPVETKYDPWPPKSSGTLHRMNQTACSVGVSA